MAVIADIDGMPGGSPVGSPVGPLRAEVGVALADRPLPEPAEDEFGRDVLAGGGAPIESTITALFANAAGSGGPPEEDGLAIIGGGP